MMLTDETITAVVKGLLAAGADDLNVHGIDFSKGDDAIIRHLNEWDAFAARVYACADLLRERIANRDGNRTTQMSMSGETTTVFDAVYAEPKRKK